MKVKGHFDHFNINVTNLERSLKFYEEALDKCSDFLLELTWLRDHTEAYELGENESHLCIRVEGDYDEVRNFHKEMGCVCFENESMGLYFINDPDDYWIEILPVK